MRSENLPKSSNDVLALKGNKVRLVIIKGIKTGLIELTNKGRTAVESTNTQGKCRTHKGKLLHQGKKSSTYRRGKMRLAVLEKTVPFDTINGINAWRRNSKGIQINNHNV